MGAGSFLPGNPVSTSQLLKHIDETFGLDVSGRGRVYADKLNIRNRHLCRDLLEPLEGPRAGHRNPEMAAVAVERALEDAGLTIDDIGYLIGHTATPATPIPSNVAIVADVLNYKGPHMELRQACTGFMNALVIAEGLLASSQSKPVVIVGSETGSVFFDPNRLKEDAGQLVNLVQMGDAAAAVVLVSAGRNYTLNSVHKGLISKKFYGHIGNGRNSGFSLKSGGSDVPTAPGGILEFSHEFADVRTNGPELFHAGLSAAAEYGLSTGTVDKILPHQANGLMDVLLEQHTGVPREKVIVNASEVGNTGSAAIWLAFAEAITTMGQGETLLALGAEATKYMFGGFLYEHC